jgi:oxygen-independent coproporphyrinogen-3 oxidase
VNDSQLFAKYDIPAPRYTSYPTVPYWGVAPTQEQWLSHLHQGLANGQSQWSMYIHVPYCESLCTFCGCNTIITKDHKKEDPYVKLIQKEWELYSKLVPDFTKAQLQGIHLGGGTPTFLSADNLVAMLTPIIEQTTRGEHFEGSIEVDPRRTNRAQLEALYKLGFRRISLGVQDFTPEIQRLVNRLQSFEETETITRYAREIGFTSVNYDLIYGLAKQTLATMENTIEQTKKLRPNRIALYSFALVPWIKPAQRLFKDEDLPTGKDKRDLYEYARTELLKFGYVEVGMDHFALADEALAIASKNGKLHRNFMGYTDQKSQVMLGLGVSSISESPQSFHQNEKLLPKYEELLNAGQIPTSRGHVLTDEDSDRRQQILSLMTTNEVIMTAEQKLAAPEFLSEMIADNLVIIVGDKVKVTEKGKPFLRNICIFFDEHLKRNKPQTRIFSQSL